jgi:UDPglucose 6-dehydrogenase
LNVIVVGLGYVGLVTAACVAEWGHRVIGVEADPRRVRDLAEGRLPFREPGLDELVARSVASGALQFASVDRVADVVADADATIIAVGTHDGNGGWQTETMRKALAGLVPHLPAGRPLIVRSTLPPEFINELAAIVASLRGRAESDLPILLNPEFTQEGRAVSDFFMPSRVICGVVSDPDGAGTALLRSLYGQTEAPFVVMPAIDASFAKLGSNLFLATKISFANELAALCDAYGARVDTVVDAMAYDPRIGRAFLGAGVGFGGSCLPHQVSMTVKTARVAGLPTPLLAAVDDINHAQRAHAVGRLESLLPDGLSGARIALLGLTFKPDTDDLRDAPAITIAQLLLERGSSVVAYDPMEGARGRAAELVSGLEVTDSAEAAMTAADAVMLVTEWREFASIDWRAARRVMRRPIVVDGRNVLNDAALLAAGFTYSGFGRGFGLPAPTVIERSVDAAEAAVGSV